MSLHEQERLTLAIQFIFDPNTNELAKDEDGNISVYKITPNGRYFVGYSGLEDSLWVNFMDLLSENTLTSVTFYSESYTKAMMPDRIAGNLSDLMIAYSRVYKSFNPNDIDTIYYKDRSVWMGYRIHYVLEEILIEDYPSGDPLPIYLLYPTISSPREIPNILNLDSVPDFIPCMAYSVNYPYTYFNKQRYRHYFPNIKLKKNLSQNISSTNKDPFNILL